MNDKEWMNGVVQKLKKPTPRQLPRFLDAHTIRTFLECPRKFELAVLDGWSVEESAIDLEFGSLVHLGLERFYNAITQGMTHDEAVKAAVSGVLEHSWDYVEDKPKLGQYADAWHCLGLEKYRNEKGNAAKCPYSHKGKIFLGANPETCGCCGSATEALRVWVPTDKVKDRYQAVRVVVWFAEEFKDSHLELVSVGDKPLTEFHWQKPWNGAVACGNVDGVFKLGDSLFVVDYKTTRQSLSKAYFSQYDPHPQVDFYNVFKEAIAEGLGLKIEGVLIQAIALTQGGVKFGVGIFRQSVAKRREAVMELAFWRTLMGYMAKLNYFPRNTSACYRCQFKKVCSAEPAARRTILAENFIQAWWNPVTRQRERLDELRGVHAESDQSGSAEAGGAAGGTEAGEAEC